jgi:hypothetical protein
MPVEEARPAADRMPVVALAPAAHRPAARAGGREDLSR